MKEYKISRKQRKILKEGHKDMRKKYKKGIPIEEIARQYSVPTEYINIVALSKNDRCIPDYPEWEYNYLTMLSKCDINIENIKSLCPKNEKYFNNNYLEWEILNMRRYKNYQNYVKEILDDC